jgi:ribosome-associated toxin RatA of RatAB toxin-antitoxin module
MPTLERSALVNYSARQMFDLVNDIEAYPQFMDGCSQARVIQRGEDWVEASLTLGKGAISQHFVTRNQLQPPQKMTMELVDGPFSHLRGQWRFDALADNACKVSLYLDFAMQNPLLGMAAAKVFESLANKQVDALCLRARKIYGE